MSFNKDDNSPQARALNNFRRMTPIFLLVIIVLIVRAYYGKKLNSDLTDVDIANYTNSLGLKNDCYFDNVTILKNPNGEIQNIKVDDKGYKIETSPFFDADTKKLIGFKVSRPQVMFCTVGMYNYKTPIVTLDRVLGNLTTAQIKEKVSKFNKDYSNKYIEKINDYLVK